MTQRNIFTKLKQTHGLRKRIYDYQRGQGMGGGVNQGLRINRCRELCIKYINNKVLLHTTGNYTQYIITTYNGKEYEKEKIQRETYADLNHFVIHWTLTHHSISTILHLKRKHKISTNYQKVPLPSSRFSVLHHLDATITTRVNSDV